MQTNTMHAKHHLTYHAADVLCQCKLRLWLFKRSEKKAMNVNRNGIMWMSERNRNKFTFDFKIAKKKSNGVDIIPICERYMWTSMRYVERVQRTIAIVCDHRSHVRRIRFLSPQTKVCCTMITRYILYKNLWARACASVPYTHTHVCVFI